MLKVSWILTKKTRTTRNYKRAANWLGFWITPDERIYHGEESHQEILDTMAPDDSYEEAFDRGWIRGYIQSGEAGFEAHSIMKMFNYVQNLVSEYAKRYRINEVRFDLNGSSYAVPLNDFLSMNKSTELRQYKG